MKIGQLNQFRFDFIFLQLFKNRLYDNGSVSVFSRTSVNAYYFYFAKPPVLFLNNGGFFILYLFARLSHKESQDNQIRQSASYSDPVGYSAFL